MQTPARSGWQLPGTVWQLRHLSLIRINARRTRRQRRQLTTRLRWSRGFSEKKMPDKDTLSCILTDSAVSRAIGVATGEFVSFGRRASTWNVKQSARISDAVWKFFGVIPWSSPVFANRPPLVFPDYTNFCTVWSLILYAQAVRFYRCVCPLCLPVTRWFCARTAKHFVGVLSSTDSPAFLLVFLELKTIAKFGRSHS